MNEKTEDISSSLEYKLASEQTVIFLINSILKDKIYKTKNIESFFEQIKEIVPSSADFFTTWLRGFYQIANFDFTKAKESYLQALKIIDEGAKIKFKDFVHIFIQQGFALFMYETEKENAVLFCNLGVELKLLAPVNESFFKNFNSKEEFWINFLPTIFIDSKKAHEKAVEDYKINVSDKLLSSLQKCDFSSFEKNASSVDLEKLRFEGISVLYYAIQFKATLKKGSSLFSEEFAKDKAMTLFSNLNLQNVPQKAKQEIFFTLYHNSKETYVEGELAKIIFEARYCRDSEIEEKICELNKIISFIIKNTNDVDSFRLNCGNKMLNTPLFLTAEVDDEFSSKELLLKNAKIEYKAGFADFSIKTKDEKQISTKIPNNFIYRLINFSSWKTLKMFLSEFPEKAKPFMTKKSETSDITPLVYFILTTVYSSKNERDFNSNRKIADELIPLFEKAGASLEQKTSFKSAKELLGLK